MLLKFIASLSKGEIQCVLLYCTVFLNISGRLEDSNNEVGCALAWLDLCTVLLAIVLELESCRDTLCFGNGAAWPSFPRNCFMGVIELWTFFLNDWLMMGGDCF